ncbi:hypothetical protein BN2537_6013 [Streptomyces venezuelae]|nr:hypothetical protein BN2537_6013 [Streptomyces venezuelae]
MQPCHNPDCSLYESPQAHTGGSQDPGVAATTGTQVTGKNGEIGRSPATG